MSLHVIEKVGEPGPDGQKWKLAEDDIHWDTLEARRQEKLQKNKKRTAKATERLALTRLAGSSDEPAKDTKLGGSSDDTLPSSDEPAGVSSDEPVPPSSDERNQNHLQNQPKPEEKDSPAEETAAVKLDPIETFIQEMDIPDAPEELTPTKKRIGDTEQEQLDIAVTDFFSKQYPPPPKGWGYLHMLGNFFTGKMKRDTTKKNQTAYFENQFDENPFDPAEIVGMIQWWFDENEDELPLQKPATIAEKAGLFRIDNRYNEYLKTGAERLRNLIAELNDQPEPEAEKEYIPVEEAEAFMADFHAELAELRS